MQLTDRAIVVSSCQARRCHPETCCCSDNEGAIMDYKPIGSGIRAKELYFGVVKYGNRESLEREVKESKLDSRSNQ